MSVELCGCSVVDNDCRWHCVRVQLFMMIVSIIVCVFSSV